MAEKKETSGGKKLSVIISIVNHKGGVGKTTTTINTAYALTKLKKKVLVVDADPQGNSSLTLGQLSPFEQPTTIEDLFMEKNMVFSTCAQPSKYENLDLVPSNIDASAMAARLSLSDPRRFMGLVNKLDDVAKKKYDFILIDCPPSLDSIFIVNALIMSNFYIIPVEAESSYALSGVDSLLKAVEVLTENTNPKLILLGALLTMFDSRTIAARVVAETTTSYFGQKNIFKTRIHRNTAVSRANITNRCVCDLEPKSSGCQNYRGFAKELNEKVKKLME